MSNSNWGFEGYKGDIVQLCQTVKAVPRNEFGKSLCNQELWVLFAEDKGIIEEIIHTNLSVPLSFLVKIQRNTWKKAYYFILEGHCLKRCYNPLHAGKMEVRCELPAPKELLEKATPGWFQVVVFRLDSTVGAFSLAHEYASQEQAEQAAQLHAGRHEGVFYHVVQCLARVGPKPPEPPESKVEWVRS